MIDIIIYYNWIIMRLKIYYYCNCFIKKLKLKQVSQVLILEFIVTMLFCLNKICFLQFKLSDTSLLLKINNFSIY